MKIHEHKKWRFKRSMDVRYKSNGASATILEVNYDHHTALIFGDGTRFPQEIELAGLVPDLTSPATQGWIRWMLDQVASVESETPDELTVTWCTKGPDQYLYFRGDDFEEKFVPALLAVWG